MRKILSNLYQTFHYCYKGTLFIKFFNIIKKKKKKKKVAAEYPKLLWVPHTFYCLLNVYVMECLWIAVYGPKIYFEKDVLPHFAPVSHFAPGYATNR